MMFGGEVPGVSRRLTLVLIAATFGVIGRPAAAQLSLPEGVSGRLSGRLHTQFNTTSVDDVGGTPLPGSEFLIRRARLTFDVTLNTLISARVEPDYSSGSFTLRDAYVRLSFGAPFQATMGQFKRPFDLFELTSSTQILVVERTGGIRGVRACGPLESVCSLSALTAGLQYSDRDVGVLVDGELAAGLVRYAAALTNGSGQNQREQSSNKQYTARVSVVPARDVVLSANAAWKDYVHPISGADRFAAAWGGDVEIGNYTSGLHVQAGVVTGENWRTGTDARSVATFLAGQVIATYKILLDHGHLRGVEPVGRLSWGDPDTDTDDDGGWLLTPGVMLHFGGRTKLQTNLDVWMPQTGDDEYSVKSQFFFYF